MKHILNLKNISVVVLASLTLFAAGCGKGEKGDSGEKGNAGQDGGGRIVSTINCTGTVSGTGLLDGLDVEYDAALTASGDVYATGTIIDLDQQYASTNFYAAGQSGAETAQVLITADFSNPVDGGYWALSLNRNTLIATAKYTDSGSASRTMTFLPSACVRKNW